MRLTLSSWKPTKMSKCSMNDPQSHYLIPEAGPAKSVQNPQPGFPNWAMGDINLTVISATTPLQATDTSEQPGMNKNSKGAERGVNPSGKVEVSNRAEELPRSTSVEQKGQPHKNILTEGPKTENSQIQQSVLKMQPVNIAIPKLQTSLTTAKTERAMDEHLRRQRNGMKGKNDDDGRSHETPLPRTLKSLRLKRLEQDSKTASNSTTVIGRTQQSDPTRIKTNHRIHSNPKGSAQRKAGETKNTNATELKEIKASSKSSASQKTSPGFHAKPYRSKTANDSLSSDLNDGKNSFTSKRGLVISKSALAGLSSPLKLSPRMNSSKTSPGSAPAKSLDCLGPNKEILRYSASVPGPGRLATSSLKTKTTFGLTMGGGSTPEGQEARPAVTEDVKTSIAPNNLLSRGLTFDTSTKSPVQTETVLFRDDVSPGKEEKKKPEICRRNDGIENSSLNALTAFSTHSGRSRTVRDSASMTDIRERFHQQRDVGIQVDFNSCSTLQKLTATSSLIGSPDRQPAIVTCKPSFHHVCKIDIELCSRTVLSSGATENVSSLPTCLRTARFQQKSDHSLSIQKIEDAEKNGGGPTQQEAEIRDRAQEVVWDKEGMTWEVYGASVDLDCLGVAIQSHLESKIKDQQKHISSLRRSICSNSNTKGCKVKRRVGVFTCCRKASIVKD